MQAYIQEFTDIFEKADIRSVTVLMMEVPCFQCVHFVLKKGMEDASKKVPMEKIIVSMRVRF